MSNKIKYSGLIRWGIIGCGNVTEVKSGVTGIGVWNFGCDHNEDRVEIFGSKGKIEFSVFKEEPLILSCNDKQEKVFIENPKNIQLYHVENMKKQLLGKDYVHPSNGYTAIHTSWVMDKILGQGL